MRAKDQFQACALATRYGESGGQPRPIFDLFLGFATSEDGALHAEKYYRTVSEEFAKARPAFRWRQLAALRESLPANTARPRPDTSSRKSCCTCSGVGKQPEGPSLQQARSLRVDWQGFISPPRFRGHH